MIKDLEACVVTWYSVHFKWRFTTNTVPIRVVLTEILEDNSEAHVHYRGEKKRCKVVGLSPNTTYTFNLHTAPPVTDNNEVTTRLGVTFTTVKCGKHDARLIAAIEDHSLVETKKICAACPEVINIPDKTGLSPMMYAAQRGYPSLIRILQENGGNVDYCNPGGKTALMLGAYHGHTHVITTLMELGCDWRKLDNAGCTALHYSIERGNLEICDALVAQGADVNMPDSRGYTGLISTCLADREDVEMARFLLDHNADPDTLSPAGETCLMAAVRTNKSGILNILIQYKADVTMKTRYGYSALDMANTGSFCQEILQQYFPQDSDSD